VTQDSLLFILGGAVMSALVGSVVYLFRLFESRNRQTESDLAECRSDREKLWQKIAELQKQIGSIQCSLDGGS
jgi:septal ring factor EnvC (AmiA/AmiB activator)